MNPFFTPARMTDLRHVETGLTEKERADAIAECKRFKAIQDLGEKWIGHPSNAPAKGIYNHVGMRVA